MPYHRVGRSKGWRQGATALLFSALVAGCGSGPEDLWVQAAGAQSGAMVLGNYGFGCLDSRCVWVQVTTGLNLVGNSLTVETRDPETSALISSQSRPVSTSGIFSFRPGTLREQTLLMSADGLQVRVTTSGSSPTSASVVVRRPIVVSRHISSGGTNRLWIGFNPHALFKASRYNLHVTDSLNRMVGQPLLGVPRAGTGNAVSLDLAAYPQIASRLTDSGVYVAVQPQGRKWNSRILVADGSVGLLRPLYRHTQLQGNFPGMGLVTIPDYLLSGNDLNYQKKPGMSKEIPFVDTFSINRFLGGMRLDWMVNRPYFDPALGQRSLDFAYLDGGQLIYRPGLIAAHLDRYLDAGYRFSQITINIENVPWDLARGGGLLGEWGNRNPPRSWDEWQQMLRLFSWHLQNLYPESKLSQLRFKLGNEYNTKTSFNGTQQDYFNYYSKSQQILRNWFPNAPIMPGEFAGNSTCANPETCVYDTGQLMTSAARAGWKLDVVPRSLHAFYSLATGRMPSATIQRAVASYAPLGAVRREIHQFGLLGHPGYAGLDLGSDTGARAAAWELQVLVGLIDQLQPARVSHWGGTWSLGPLTLLTGRGFLRNILDNYLGYELIKLRNTLNYKSATNEVGTYLLYRHGEAILLIANYSDLWQAGTTNVRVNLPSYLTAAQPALAQSGYIAYNQQSCVHALVRNVLQYYNNLKPYFVNHPNSLATLPQMAIDSAAARQVILSDPGRFEAYSRANLSYRPIAETNRIAVGHDAGGHYVWAQVKHNELLVLRIR